MGTLGLFACTCGCPRRLRDLDAFTDFDLEDEDIMKIIPPREEDDGGDDPGEVTSEETAVKRPTKRCQSCAAAAVATSQRRRGPAMKAETATLRRRMRRPFDLTER